MTVFPRTLLLCTLACGLGGARAQGQDDRAAVYERDILPILENHCYQCHGDGEDKGKVSFDGSTAELLAQTDLWVHALKNVRSGMMPPAKKERLSADELATLENWIIRGALQLDPAHPDPGRVTLRRLNRIEYRNTIRDLMGIDFRTDEEFPADDTGYGFDTIGDVLTTSPMLLEKYMQAAEAIVATAVPVTGREIPERRIEAHFFNGKGGRDGSYSEQNLSLYDAADLTAEVEVPHAGTYRVELDATVRGSFAFDPGQARLQWFVGGERRLDETVKWENGRQLRSSVEVRFQPGKQPLRLVMEPQVGKDQKPANRGDGDPNVDLRFRGATLVGPLEPEFAKRPKNYRRFFPREEVPAGAEDRRTYAREILTGFTARAFRRPADAATLDRLTALAMESMDAAGGSFERGVARAMTAVLASPRFLFRIEDTLPETTPGAHPLLDEWALASRVSYFLWSTMPDQTLLDLAAAGKLRENLPAQIDRLLRDARSKEFVSNFAGQWLQTRDVGSVSIDARSVVSRDFGGRGQVREQMGRQEGLRQRIQEARDKGADDEVAALQRELAELKARLAINGDRVEFSGSLRTAMRREAEMLFEHVLRSNGSVLGLVENDSTFLNEELATYYGVPGVTGVDMRLVKLPPESVRGGVITMGSTLAVTSNPTRTSPVKRGLFILDNILGTPPPPAPPDIPSLEASEKNEDGSERSLREALALHREQPLCSSCHNRMDPLGLALENFNAMGHWRDQEQGAPLESPSGKLITGEPFADVRELKRLIVTARRTDYYRCLTEKLLTYALGRGPQPCDIPTVDHLTARLEETEGRFSTLIHGIIDSPPFQRRRNLP